MEVAFSVPAQLYLLRHPFYQAWMEGTLPREALQDYARQYSHHVEAFPRYLQEAIAHAIGTAGESILRENLAEEDGTAYGTSHPELWLRFAEGVGASRESVASAVHRPAIRNVVETFTALARASLPEALGALYAYESQVPEIAGSKIEGLKKHFQILDQRTLAFFEVHQTADVAHRESVLKLIASLSPADQRRAQDAANRVSQALWDFLSDVHDVSRCA